MPFQNHQIQEKCSGAQGCTPLCASTSSEGQRNVIARTPFSSNYPAPFSFRERRHRSIGSITLFLSIISRGDVNRQSSLRVFRTTRKKPLDCVVITEEYDKGASTTIDSTPELCRIIFLSTTSPPYMLLAPSSGITSMTASGD
jgi:hypothetical protein